VIASLLAIWSVARQRAGAAVLVLCMGAALAGLGWCWGYGIGRAGIAPAVAAERAHQAQQQLQAVQQAQSDFRERVRMGEQAEQGLRAELRVRDQRITALQRSTAHAPQVIATATCGQPGDVRLSVGAVRLYDASLSGADQQLPGSACGVAGDGSGPGVAGACAQASAVTVDEFVSAAASNAALHGECQARMRRLVEFLRSRAE